MIGNDVVDLVLARRQSDWRRKGFLQKIFTEAEQSWIDTADEPDEMVWLLWSMKEAAYKVYNRETGLRGFSPLSFSCDAPQYSLGLYIGKVHCGTFSLLTKSSVTDNLIVTECYSNKDIITYFLNDYEGYLNKKIIYKNDEGVPFIEGNIPVSVSHHGRFCIVSVYGDDEKLLLGNKLATNCTNLQELNL